MSGKTRAYAARVDIDASVERVWRAITQESGLRRWLSPGARIAVQLGGTMCGSLDRLRQFRARIDVLDPPRRLRLVHFPAEELRGVDALIVDDVLLEPRGPETVVRVLGSGFPRDDACGDFYMRRQIGWRRALARLKVYLEKGMDLESRA